MHNGTCLKCTDLDSQCNGCSYDGIGIICTSCNAGYYLDSVLKTCILCSATILDCQECQVKPLTFKIECTLCSSLFLVDNNFTCEKCKEYKYVTRTCTNVTGCLSSQLINGILVCLGCDATLNFIYNTTTKKCQCNTGFVLDQPNSQCIEICGDGIREFMECDDGNTINGDGCSDQCKIENNFICTTSLTGLSSCVLNADISIVYDYTLRQMGENKLSMYFTVSPAYTALDKVDWHKAITFNFSETINPSFQYQDGILIITIDYSADLDGKMMNLTIEFDHSIVNSDSQIIGFEMGAINGPLSYESESSLASYKVFSISGLIFSLICLLFYLISSYFHKMIGLETIQFIQTIYFVRLISGTSVSSCFYAFNSLKYSNGYNDIIPTTSNNSAEDLLSIPSGFIKLNLKLFFLENCNLMLIPVGLATIGYIFYSVKKSRSQALYTETKERIYKDLMIIQNRKIEWIYDSLIFSFTLSLLHVIVFSIFLYELSILQPKSLFSQSFIILSYGTSLVVLFFVSGIYCYEVILGIKKSKSMTENNENVRSEEKSMEHDGNGANHGFHPLYVSFYLFYQLMMIVLMSIMAFIKFNFLIESVLGFAALYLIMIILWKPYKVSIHNKAIIFHQSTIIAFILFQLLSKYKAFPVILVNPFLYIILALIVFALVLQIVRLYIHIKLSKKLSSLEQNLDNEEHSETKNKMEKKKLVLNPYSYEAQMLSLVGEIPQPNYSFFSNEKFLHQIMPPDLTIKSQRRIKEKSKSLIPIELQDTNNEMMEEKSDDNELSELELKKFRLRQELDIFYENPTLKEYDNL